MKIRYISDLHMEISLMNPLKDFITEPSDEILVLPGDICSMWSPYESAPTSEKNFRLYVDFMKWCSDHFKHVIAVLGNHDYWGLCLNFSAGRHSYWTGNMFNDRSPSLCYKQSVKSLQNVTILFPGDSVNIDGVHFVGSTMWTDVNKRHPESMGAGYRYMNDFRSVSKFDTYSRSTPSAMTIQDWVDMHDTDTEYLLQVLGKIPDGEHVVLVQHMAPFQASSHPRYRCDPINFMFYGRTFEDWINRGEKRFAKVNTILHGHMHDPCHYTIKSGDDMYNIDVRCNPFGYPREKKNHDFDQFLEI